MLMAFLTQHFEIIVGIVAAIFIAMVHFDESKTAATTTRLGSPFCSKHFTSICAAFILGVAVFGRVPWIVGRCPDMSSIDERIVAALDTDVMHSLANALRGDAEARADLRKTQAFVPIQTPQFDGVRQGSFKRGRDASRVLWRLRSSWSGFGFDRNVVVAAPTSNCFSAHAIRAADFVEARVGVDIAHDKLVTRANRNLQHGVGNYTVTLCSLA